MHRPFLPSRPGNNPKRPSTLTVLTIILSHATYFKISLVVLLTESHDYYILYEDCFLLINPFSSLDPALLESITSSNSDKWRSASSRGPGECGFIGVTLYSNGACRGCLVSLPECGYAYDLVLVIRLLKSRVRRLHGGRLLKVVAPVTIKFGTLPVKVAGSYD